MPPSVANGLSAQQLEDLLFAFGLKDYAFYLTPNEIDFLVAGEYPITPSIPGKFLVVDRIIPVWTTLAGAHSGAGSQSMGNNSTRNNIFAASGLITATSVSFGSKSKGTAFAPGVMTLTDLVTPIYFNIITPPSGLTTAMGKMITIGSLIDAF